MVSAARAMASASTAREPRGPEAQADREAVEDAARSVDHLLREAGRRMEEPRREDAGEQAQHAEAEEGLRVLQTVSQAHVRSPFGFNRSGGTRGGPPA